MWWRLLLLHLLWVLQLWKSKKKQSSSNSSVSFPGGNVIIDRNGIRTDAVEFPSLATSGFRISLECVTKNVWRKGQGFSGFSKSGPSTVSK
ncbi:unnamed protein product [Brassica rapa subsp. trilocularis]